MRNCSGLLLLLILGAVTVKAQGFKDGKLMLNQSGSHYMKFTLLNQAWLRYGQLNDGSTQYGYPHSHSTDIGIRRMRLQMLSQINDRTFLYMQVGQNNLNALSERKTGFFLHDITGEYAVIPERLSLGGGLTGWAGFSRFSSPAVGSIMGLDAPLYLQATNDVTDQFLRKLSVFAKGKSGDLDYVVTLSQPMAIQRTANYTATVTSNSSVDPDPAMFQWNSYVQWQFFDHEANLLPYRTGTYLGKKKVFNIGGGIEYQPRAFWYKNESGDILRRALMLTSLDVFADMPHGTNGEAISLYGNVARYDFGPGYIRNLSPMNPSTGSDRIDILNGGGNGFPAFGTGMVYHAQAGYKLRDSLAGKTTFMPYASITLGDYDRLKQLMLYYEAGINWLLSGHNSKLTIGLQSRPEYLMDGTMYKRKYAGIVQYQVFLN